VVFSGFHLSPLLGGVVVVAGQVKDAMDGVAHDFVGPGGVEPLGVEQGDGDADKHLAVQGDGIEGVSMVEADDVGGVGVLEEGEVQAGDFPGIDEVDAEGVAGDFEAVLKPVTQEGAQLWGPDGLGALPVAEDEFPGRGVNGGSGGIRRHG
jgi:hypothetical protein